MMDEIQNALTVGRVSGLIALGLSISTTSPSAILQCKLANSR